MKLSILGLLLAVSSGHAITLDTTDSSSIISAAKVIADRIVSRYNGTAPGEVPGLFPRPYYWWESGLAWDSLINYWALTGDDAYNAIVTQALLWQVGPDENYMPPNQTRSLGNDDQSFWALAAMTAAEQGLPIPANSSSNLTWVQLAEAVFNTQALRWDEGICTGGLRWQIFTFNAGYTYKNALTNGNFYQLASRLALYTANSTYSDWAQRVLEWTHLTGLLGNDTQTVFDGLDATTNCSSMNRIEWSANTGTYLSGAVYLQNYSSTLRNSGPPFALYIGINETFARGRVLYEPACETSGNCNTDQLAFKAITSRALARARDLSSDSSITVNGSRTGTLRENMNLFIQTSARAAAAQCSGGETGSVCGTNWLSASWDGTQGLGQDLSALEIILAVLPGNELRNINTTATMASGNSANSTSSTGSNTTDPVASGTPGSTSFTGTGSINNVPGLSSASMLAVGLAIVAFII